jgi:pimeloyl-ACP methyl ester carboxylesterase
MLIPAENSRIIAGRIPGARAIYIKKAGHGFFYEAAEEASDIIESFLLGMQ